jgi:hypothetical protein
MNELTVPEEVIMSKIYVIRGQKVMLDRDLAALYNVETRALNQAVKRNYKRFPSDFMFILTKEEMNKWKSQIVISNRLKMGLRKHDGSQNIRTYEGEGEFKVEVDLRFEERIQLSAI